MRAKVRGRNGEKHASKLSRFVVNCSCTPPIKRNSTEQKQESTSWYLIEPSEAIFVFVVVVVCFENDNVD